MTAKVTSKVPTTEVRAGEISVGDLGAGVAVTPLGTVTLRQDRTAPFLVQNLSWSFTVADSMMTPQERGASMDAVDATLAALPGVNVVADNQELVRFMASRPEFIAAGTSDNGLTAWGKWRDGVQYLVVRSREPSAASVARVAPKAAALRAQPAVSRAAASAPPPQNQLAASAAQPEDGHPSNLPDSNQVRLLSSLGAFSKQLDPLRF